MTKSDSGVTDNLRAVVVSSINQVSPEEWDRVGSSHGLFWTHRFFRALEDSGVENATYHYVLIYDDSRLMGTAVLSSFVVSLDLLLSPAVQKFCRVVRNILPRFLRIRVLFCGVPISIGKHTVALAEPEYAHIVVAKVAEMMNEIATREGIRYLCFKEFAERDIASCAPLERHGFFRAHSVPRVFFPIRWTSYDAYLRDMRYGYRRPVLSSLKKLGQKWRIRSVTEGSRSEGVCLRLDNGRLCSPIHFHSLYLQVMDHTVVKLETLNARFFELLFEQMNDDMDVLVLEHEEEILGAAILTKYQGTLTFMFVGFDYAHRDEHAVYLNLLNGIVRHAVETGCNLLDLGQTSYWLKQRLGGQTESMYFYFRCRSRLLHTLLQVSRRVLFPPTRLPKLKVFRD
jgi:predicted N-acyltransferase